MLCTLKVSSIATIVERLRPLLHIDPVTRLPPEITAQIFSYLAPPFLLEASKVSKAWRDRTLDSRLWKQKFVSEGWALNMREVLSFEESVRLARGLLKSRSRKAGVHGDQRLQKRRARDGHRRVDDAATSSKMLPAKLPRQDDVRSWNDQQGPVEADTDVEVLQPSGVDDVEMHDATVPPFESTSMHGLESSRKHSDTKSSFGSSIDGTQDVAHNLQNTIPSSDMAVNTCNETLLVRPGLSSSVKVNFHQVYKQKRRLEENWTAGRFKSFQLPHKDFPNEAHTECVYTIQYSGKYLVSGSRDHTLRIWDLDTQRLIKPPLAEHKGSVLCLQFDDTEKEDIIISGSSDTSIILWRFSTGKMIRRISGAHRESVLNLKFDSRFLVTCSKDKTIKIWNRNEVRPGDPDYPVKGVQGGGKCPSYIMDLASFPTPIELEQHLSDEQKQPLAPYRVLMTIDSHGAAVNAVHIHNEQLVSASGDRSLKVWDIHSGVCTAVCMGHTKGIACVQYDGKRIISGSSDDTIRIFDPATQAEVACLQGHTKLVRTVQAAFGDLPGTEEELAQEASEADRAFFEAKLADDAEDADDLEPDLGQTARRQGRNPGSRRPQDIMAYGAKLPPGGGGSRWSRIVSGSYDETIIVWRRASDGRWVPAHKLNQADALRAAGGPLIARSERQQQLQQLHHLQHAALHHHHPHGPLVVPQTYPMQTVGGVVQPTALQIQQMHAQLYNHQLLQQQQQQQHATQAGGPHPPGPPFPNQQQQQQHPQAGFLPIAPFISFAHLNPPAQPTPAPQAAQAAPAGSAPGPTAPPAQQPQQPQQQQHLAHVQQHLTHHEAAMAQAQLQAYHQAHHHPAQALHPGAPAAAAVAVAAGGGGGMGPSQPNARVFKLQFDARRIICCSQDPKIVGWDFADGDEDIMAASAFFGPPV